MGELCWSLTSLKVNYLELLPRYSLSCLWYSLSCLLSERDVQYQILQPLGCRVMALLQIDEEPMFSKAGDGGPGVLWQWWCELSCFNGVSSIWSRSVGCPDSDGHGCPTVSEELLHSPKPWWRHMVCEEAKWKGLELEVAWTHTEPEKGEGVPPLEWCLSHAFDFFHLCHVCRFCYCWMT